LNPEQHLVQRGARRRSCRHHPPNWMSVGSREGTQIPREWHGKHLRLT